MKARANRGGHHTENMNANPTLNVGAALLSLLALIPQPATGLAQGTP